MCVRGNVLILPGQVLDLNDYIGINSEPLLIYLMKSFVLIGP